VLNALTVDVEDYFQVSAFDAHVSRDSWDSREIRVANNTERVLDLFDECNVKATFFVLGWVASHCPSLVRDILDRGHEIGSHSYWHRLVYSLTPAQFRDDVRRSRDVLESISGNRVRAFRAPSFSVTRASLWAIDILIEEGFDVDSSIFPGVHDRYGIPDSEVGPYQITRPAGSLWEFPPTLARFGGMRIPACGGGYFRLFPTAWTTYWLGRVIRREDRPCMFYIHPWELDPSQPRIAVRSRMSRFRHYVNLGSTEPKLRCLLSRLTFGRLSDVRRRFDSISDSAQATAAI
jgi:polysaccharide deacetylase family protein (PEP-CTERM system associated)